MKPKLPLCLALVLSFLSARNIVAQPGGGIIYRSLETRIAQAPVVFRGTITNVLETVIPDHNQFSAYAGYDYSVSLRVDEVLKGSVPNASIVFAFKVQQWKELLKWGDEHASFLWFLKDGTNSIGTDFVSWENAIYLGPTLPGREDDSGFNFFPAGYDMDMNLLTNSADTLSWAKQFSKRRSKVEKFHSFYLPQQSTSDHYFFNSQVVVPVEPSLEKTAKHLIAAPEDFISSADIESSKRRNEPNPVPQWRADLRADGVDALQYFKSAENIKLLKSLLDSPDFWMKKDWSVEYPDTATNKIYSVRSKAYEVLTGWGVDVPKPVTEEIIRVSQTKP